MINMNKTLVVVLFFALGRSIFVVHRLSQLGFPLIVVSLVRILSHVGDFFETRTKASSLLGNFEAQNHITLAIYDFSWYDLYA